MFKILWLVGLISSLCVVTPQQSRAQEFTTNRPTDPICEIHNVKSSEGSLRNPEYPKPPSKPFCSTWFIQGRQDDRISVSIPSLELPNSRPCAESYLSLNPDGFQYCGNCNDINGHSFTSKGNHLWVTLRYNNSSGYVVNKGISIDFAVRKAKASFCKAGDFMCGEKRCIPELWRCNQVSDCVMKNDELGCSWNLASGTAHIQELSDTSGNWTTPCYPKHYKAWIIYGWKISLSPGKRVEIRFIAFALTPNNTLFIYDGKDARAPILRTLTAYSIVPNTVLASGASVYIELRSNSRYHANTEEETLGIWGTYQNYGDCLPEQSRCLHNETGCYTAKQRCDNTWDCPRQGGDERGCGSCTFEEFACNSRLERGQCFTPSDRCTGIAHCQENTDEENCTPAECGPHHGTFLCDNSLCIYEKYKCDGAADCSDASDEKNCSVMMDRKVITAAVIGSLLCGTLLIVALGIITKLHGLRTTPRHHRSRYISPIGRIQQQILDRQSAPPLYDEAMRTSRPYDEMMTILQRAFCTDPPPPLADSEDDDDPMLDVSMPTRRPQPDGSSLALHEEDGGGAECLETRVGETGDPLTGGSSRSSPTGSSRQSGSKHEGGSSSRQTLEGPSQQPKGDADQGRALGSSSESTPQLQSGLKQETVAPPTTSSLNPADSPGNDVDESVRQKELINDARLKDVETTSPSSQHAMEEVTQAEHVDEPTGEAGPSRETRPSVATKPKGEAQTTTCEGENLEMGDTQEDTDLIEEDPPDQDTSLLLP